MTRIDLVYFDAGGGHRATARALLAWAEQQGDRKDIRMVNMREVLAGHDALLGSTGHSLEKAYNTLLSRGWTFGAAAGLRLLQQAIRRAEVPLVERMARYWQQGEGPPDMVVALVPNFNAVLYKAIKKVAPNVPYVTLMTDLADYPPHFWIEKGQDQFFIVGTDRAARQVRAAGYAEDRLFQVNGMVVHPAFYTEQTFDRDAERRTVGLPTDEPVGLVMFGGHGSAAMVTIAEHLRHRPLILVTGHNGRLAERLRRLPTQAPRHIVGFTDNVPHLMRMADYFIGKPGPGSVSEAMAMKLPVIVAHNHATLPQERFNATWVRHYNRGVVVRHFRDVAGAVDRVLCREPYRDSVASFCCCNGVAAGAAVMAMIDPILARS